MAHDVTVCTLLTVWQYRYPRLLGRVWYSDRFKKQPPGYHDPRKPPDPPADASTLGDDDKLAAWLNSTFPGGDKLPGNGTYRVETEPGLDGLVLYPDGLILPCPPDADIKDAEILRLARYAANQADVDAINRNRKRFTSWVLPLEPTGAAEALARRLQHSHGWALTDRTLDRLEKAMDRAVLEVWKGFIEPGRYEARVNELLQAGGTVPGFRLRVHPKMESQGGDYFNKVVFDAEGAWMPPCPLDPNMLDRLEELPGALRSECDFEPC